MKTDNENLASIENEATRTAEKKTPLKHKRIELIGLTLLLVAGILLMPIRLTQNEAKAADPVTVISLAIPLGTFLVSVITTWLMKMV